MPSWPLPVRTRYRASVLASMVADEIEEKCALTLRARVSEPSGYAWVTVLSWYTLMETLPMSYQMLNNNNDVAELVEFVCSSIWR